MLPTAAALGPWDKPRSWCDPGRALGGSTVRPPWAPKRVWGCAGVSRPPGGRRGLRGHGTAPPRGEAGGKSFPAGRGPARASAPQVGCVPVRGGPEPKSPRAARQARGRFPRPGRAAIPPPATGGQQKAEAKREKRLASKRPPSWTWENQMQRGPATYCVKNLEKLIRGLILFFSTQCFFNTCEHLINIPPRGFTLPGPGPLCTLHLLSFPAEECGPQDDRLLQGFPCPQDLARSHHTNARSSSCLVFSSMYRCLLTDLGPPLIEAAGRADALAPL